MGLRDSLRSLLYGPPARTYLPPIEARAVNITNYAPPIPYGYAGRTDIGPALRAGTLIHGPGATQALRDAYGQAHADNSAAWACLQVLTRAYVEPPLKHYTGPDADDREEVAGSALTALLRRPNPFMPGKPFLRYMQWCKQVTGNAYWRKIRAGDALSGNVIELWPISPQRIAPVTYKGSGDFISAYRYWATPSRYEDIPVENIVHFRAGIDDDDPRVGCSALQRLSREIAGDNEAIALAYRLLRNNAVPGLVVVPPKDALMDEQQAETVKARIEAAYGGENAGRVGVVSPGADMKMIGFDPKSMDISSLLRAFEERISAVLGVPAIMAGLGAGLENATYSNVRELKEFFTEGTLVPLWAEDAETLTHQLLPDFSAVAEQVVDFDLDNVRALQQDEDALWTRISAAVVAGWLKPSDAQQMVGMEPDLSMDVAPAPAPAQDNQPPPANVRAFGRKALSPVDFERSYRALGAALEDETRRALADYQAGLRLRVRQRLKEGA